MNFILIKILIKDIIMVSGNMVKDMVEDNKFGVMDHNMMDIGEMIWQIVEVD